MLIYIYLHVSNNLDLHQNDRMIRMTNGLKFSLPLYKLRKSEEFVTFEMMNTFFTSNLKEEKDGQERDKGKDVNLEFSSVKEAWYITEAEKK